ncbi:MAG: efflux RND transporter periplasmic adaptor subunit [Aeromonas sp.]
MKIRLWLLLGSISLIFAIYYFWSPSLATQNLSSPPVSAAAGKGKRPQRPVAIVSQLVKADHSARSLPLVGELSAAQSVSLGFEVSGRIAQFLVQAGQTVSAGTPLIRLHDAQAASSVAELRATLALESKKLRDVAALLRKTAVTQAEVDAQTAAVAVAHARLENSQVTLAKHTLHAPFSGVVGLTAHSVGAQIASGEVLLTLDNPRELYLDLAVPAHYAVHLAPNVSISARSAAWAERRFVGQLLSRDSRVNAATQNQRLRFVFRNPDGALQPGAQLTVALPLPNRARVRIPAQAVEFSGDKRFVYRLMPAPAAAGASSPAPLPTVRRVAVEVGQLHGEQIEVLAGIAVGDRIVVEGLVSLRDGAQVKELRSEMPPRGQPEAGHVAF